MKQNPVRVRAGKRHGVFLYNSKTVNYHKLNEKPLTQRSLSVFMRPIKILLIGDNRGGGAAMAFLRHEGQYVGVPRPGLVLTPNGAKNGAKK